MSEHNPEHPLRTPADAALVMQELGMSVVGLIEGTKRPSIHGHSALGIVRPGSDRVGALRGGVALVGGLGYFAVDIDEGGNEVREKVERRLGRSECVIIGRPDRYKLVYATAAPHPPDDLLAAALALIESGQHVALALRARAGQREAKAAHKARLRHLRQLKERFVAEHGLIRSCTRASTDGKVKVEILGIGRLIVMPPTVHPATGEPYRFEDGAGLTEDSFFLPRQVKADEVEELLDELAPRPARASATRRPARRRHEEAELLPRVRSALEHLSLDDYHLWITVGMALKGELGDAGLELWEEASQQSHKYVEGECEAKWESFADTAQGGVGLGTVFHEARQSGWDGRTRAVHEFADASIPETTAVALRPKSTFSTVVQPAATQQTELQEWLEDYNKRFAVVRAGSDVRVLVRPGEGEEVVFLKEAAFHRLNHADRCEVTRQGRNGKEETAVEPVSKCWMAWEGRKTFSRGVTFDPSAGPEVDGMFNLWSGWAVRPAPGDWSMLRRHVYENVCRENALHFAWTVCWFADLLQRPAKKPGSALVLRGKEGTGKSFLAKHFRKLAPKNSCSISKAKQVTGDFNRHLATSVLTVCEEAFFAGDQGAASALRDMITSETQQVEPKGMDSFEAPNHQRVVLISNADWAIHASTFARRFMVLEVGDGRRNDTAYFAQIERQMAGGGLAGMMHDLMALEIPGWVNLRQPPQTRWLVEQKVQSLPSHQEWWRTCLMDESINKDEWPEQCDCDTVYGLYLSHAKAKGDRHPKSKEALGKLLSAMGVTRRQTTAEDLGGTRRYYAYFFPPVEELRLTFERHFHLSLSDEEDCDVPQAELDGWKSFGTGGPPPRCS